MKRAGDLIGKLFSNISSEDLKTYGELFSTWKELAGTDIAAHSRILELQKGLLYVGVDHPGWMQMIGFKKQQILKSLKSRYPSLEIRDLRLMLIEGVPEEVLEERFNGEEEPPPAEAQDPPDEEPVTSADFQAKLQKLRRSVEEKWKDEKK